MDIKLLDRKGVYINAIDAHSVMREQVDGGQDTLTFKTSWRPIDKGSRVVVQLPTLDWQEYVVTGLIETAEAVEVSCEHAIYDMFGEFIEDLRPTGTADYLLDTALQCSRWKRLGSSTSGSYSTNFYRTSVREAVSKIQELSGLVLRYRVDVAGAAVTNRWCWWEQPGANNRGFRFESGLNAERIERRIDDSQIVTSLYGFGRGQYNAETGGYSRRVDFSSINGGLAYVEDAAAVASYGRQIFGKIEFDDTEDADEVLARTQAELAIRSVPQVRYSGAVYDLGFDDSVSVGETVILQTSDVMGIRVLGRVLRLVSYLDRSTPNRITIGNYTDIFAPVKAQRTLAAIREQLATDPTRGGLGAVNSKIVSELLENFNAQINEGFLTGTVTALPGGFIFESVDGATHIGPDGWRVANTKNPDGSWAFTTLATGDGLAAGVVGAEQIIAGAITTESIYIGDTTSLQDKINEFDAIEIGGRNLLSNTEGTFEVIKTDTAAYNDAIHGQTINIPDGDEYILSFKAKASAPMVLLSYFYNPSTTTRAESSTGYIGNEPDGNVQTNITTEWDSYWIKWNQSETVTPKGVIIARILAGYNNVSLEIKEIKLEKGNIATDWTPAPEDVSEEIATRTAKVQETARIAAEDYANAQKALTDATAKAYADGILTTAENKAIAEAASALSQANQNLNTATANLQNFVLQHVSDETAEIKSYIRSNASGNLEIGSLSGVSKLVQSPTAMTFMVGSMPVATFGAGETDMPKAGVDTELRIGDKASNYHWVSDTDGGMSLIWK